jgi:Cys-tRNA(Pro)/Cys-tRNA(Cys) deacylase
MPRLDETKAVLEQVFLATGAASLYYGLNMYFIGTKEKTTIALVKTNAMRILDKEKLSYEMLSYQTEDGKIDGVAVAAKIGRDAGIVYKTLVAHAGQNYYVFVIPVGQELDLKKAAKAAGAKKIEMLPVKELVSVTGYIRGGCSPIGMKKSYPTFIAQSAEHKDTIIVSGGKIGVQIELPPQVLLSVVHGQWADLTFDEI